MNARRLPLAGCLISLLLLAACNDDSDATQPPAASAVGTGHAATPTAGGISLTNEQKQLAWNQANATPWASSILAHASQRASFVPIGDGTVLQGVAVTVFFDEAVVLPAGLPTLAAAGEGDSSSGNRKITTNTPQKTGSAVTLFVIDGTALWMAVVPQPIADHDLATLSEPWPPPR